MDFQIDQALEVLHNTPDTCDIADGSPDTDNNGVPDECDVDCNSNGIPDTCDIADGSPDTDDNGVPDICEGAIPTTSQWGLLMIALLLLIAAKGAFGRVSSSVKLR